VWRRLTAFGLALAAAVGLLVGVTSAADAAGLSDPAQNVPSSYWPVCSQAGANSQTCTDAVVAAINHARSLEGVGPMVLPTDFASLSPAQQTFVVSNVERVDRGLAPVAGMVDSLNTLAAGAAANDADPMLPTWTIGSFHAVMWGSIWAGDLNPLASDYDWMYNDGWSPSGSINLDCTSASADGCWGHRHVILSAGDHLITGVATVQQSSWMSDAQIFVAGSGTYPAFTYSWADVVGTTPTPDVTQVDANDDDSSSSCRVARVADKRDHEDGQSDVDAGARTDGSVAARAPNRLAHGPTRCRRRAYDVREPASR
jgi:hypothetical protein